MISTKWLLVSLGVFLGVAVFWWARTRFHQMTYWAVATGTIVDQWSYGNKHFPVIEFTDRSGQLRKLQERTVGQVQRSWDLRSSISVRYNPQNSMEAIVDKPMPYFGIGLSGLILGVVFILSGLFLI